MPKPDPQVRILRESLQPFFSRQLGVAAAAGFAMLICMLPASAVQLHSQTSGDDSSKAEDEYHLGNEGGSEAGLWVARGKSATKRGARDSVAHRSRGE